MMNFLPKHSKKGITLVESVIAVVCLAILTIGIISLLSTGSAKIIKTGHTSAAASEATQKMDLLISAISNGSGIKITNESTGAEVCDLDLEELNTLLSLGGAEVSSTRSFYEEPDPVTMNEPYGPKNVRGWYLTLTWNGVTVRGFASNTEGAFDGK